MKTNLPDPALLLTNAPNYVDKGDEYFDWDNAIISQNHVELKNKLGRPKQHTTKQSTTIRLDTKIIEHFKAGGKGWQTRINDALLKLVEG